jgi:small GTP-binding protein
MSFNNKSNDKSSNINLKILILGDSSVGKTTLLLKYVDGYFPKIYVATIGVEFKIKKININGIDINLQIWDTAGQERFRGVTRNFLKGADGIIYAYDITKKSSFDNLKNWILQAEETTCGFKQIIIGNKSDLNKERTVTKEMFQKFCQNKNIQGMEVSAKNGSNVEKCFELIAKLIIEGKSKEQLIERYSEAGRNRGKSIVSREMYKKNNNKDKDKKGCC